MLYILCYYQWLTSVEYRRYCFICVINDYEEISMEVCEIYGL